MGIWTPNMFSISIPNMFNNWIVQTCPVVVFIIQISNGPPIWNLNNCSVFRWICISGFWYLDPHCIHKLYWWIDYSGNLNSKLLFGLQMWILFWGTLVRSTLYPTREFSRMYQASGVSIGMFSIPKSVIPPPKSRHNHWPSPVGHCQVLPFPAWAWSWWLCRSDGCRTGRTRAGRCATWAGWRNC